MNLRDPQTGTVIELVGKHPPTRAAKLDGIVRKVALEISGGILPPRACLDLWLDQPEYVPTMTIKHAWRVA